MFLWVLFLFSFIKLNIYCVLFMVIEVMVLFEIGFGSVGRVIGVVVVEIVVVEVMIKVVIMKESWGVVFWNICRVRGFSFFNNIVIFRFI